MAKSSAKRTSGKPRTLIGAERKLSGALSIRVPSKYFAVITPCGQTKLHCPHWTHVPSSHTGTISAMLRFSHTAVPDGQVPSIGMRLTGMSSPRPSSIRAVTSRTNAGAEAGTTGGVSHSLVAAAGTVTSNSRARVSSTAR